MRNKVEHFSEYFLNHRFYDVKKYINSTNFVQLRLRRAGHNPTDVEVTDIINKIDSDSGNIDFQVRLLSVSPHSSTLSSALFFQAFCSVMQERSKNFDMESGYKETFRVFSKDDDGCIPAAEIRWAI